MIDLVLCWPDNNDYPLFRQFIRNNRALFDKVIIVFTKTYIPPNISTFIVKAMREDNVLFLLNPHDPIANPENDWRNVAVNEALKFSASSHVLFIEQDFIVNNISQFVDISNMYINSGEEVIGVMDKDRLHPCYLLMKRTLLRSLKNDFSAHPPEYDHFGSIQKQLEGRNIKPAIIPESLYLHLNGTSSNWNLLLDKKEPNYKPEQFKTWLGECLKVKVPLNYLWCQTAKRYLGLMWE
jgi:hypothetical protein